MSPAFRAALTEAMAGEKPVRRPRRAWRTALLTAALEEGSPLASMAWLMGGVVFVLLLGAL